MKWLEDKNFLTKTFIEFIRRTTSDLPKDVVEALVKAKQREQKGSASYNVLEICLENIRLAKELSRPLCQDTGTNIWYIYYPAGNHEITLHESIVEATKQATALYYFRPNSVNPITGKNSGDNTGKHAPFVHFHQWDKPYLQAALLLKGGGCENVSTQYSLPYNPLNANRDLDGIRKAVLHAIHQAQGKGCAPGIIGVGVGGDRLIGHQIAKEQLFRALNHENPEPVLNELEEKIMNQANELEIGPMGFGGKTTVLGVKIGFASRVPASYYVSVAYLCWAARRKAMKITDENNIEFSDSYIIE